MSRTQTNPVDAYFSKDKIIKKSKCLVDNCKITLNGLHSGNMETHLRTNHKKRIRRVTVGKSKGDKDKWMSSEMNCIDQRKRKVCYILINKLDLNLNCV